MVVEGPRPRATAFLAICSATNALSQSCVHDTLSCNRGAIIFTFPMGDSFGPAGTETGSQPVQARSNARRSPQCGGHVSPDLWALAPQTFRGRDLSSKISSQPPAPSGRAEAWLCIHSRALQRSRCGPVGCERKILVLPFLCLKIVKHFVE